MRSVVSPEIEAGSITASPVACSLPLGALSIVTAGTLVYPLPLFVMMIFVNEPPVITALAVALIPFPPGTAILITGTAT